MLLLQLSPHKYPFRLAIVPPALSLQTSPGSPRSPTLPSRRLSPPTSAVMSMLVYATCARRPRNVNSLLAHNSDPSSSHPSKASAKAPTTAGDPSSPCNTNSPSSSSSVATAGIRPRPRLSSLTQSNSFKYLIAGAIAGIVSRTAVSPLEVVATINMCTAGATRPPPILQQLRNLFATEGMRGFFKGNAANCLKVAPTKGIQFVAFEAFKRALYRIRQRRKPDGDPKEILSPGERFLAGGMAGIVAAVVCYPLDTAKTLLTTHPEKFSGVLSTITTVARTQGARGLYRGLSPTLVAMMPYVGLDFAIYEQLKLCYQQRTKKEANLLALLFIGAFAGAVAQTACHPLDVVRKRLQLQGLGGRPVQYKSMFDAASGIVRTEGVWSLFRGLQPMYISAIPSAGVSYVVYEFTKRTLGVRSFQ